ncbi:MAG: serine hydrolase [Pleurocapsa sp. SU_196_0]|nr:serine hydrolase [Pleurocapsa sp. SU_196_0]
MLTPTSPAVAPSLEASSAAVNPVVTGSAQVVRTSATGNLPPSSPSSAEVTVVRRACALPPEPVKFIAPPAVPKVITGRVGLFVGRLTRGQDAFRFDRATWLNPQSQFPLASNYKTSVLYELMRAVDSGDVKLTERFNVTKANQSYGRYPYDNSDVMTLANAMIAWSDNTATDILHRRVELDGLQGTARDLRLCNTRLLLPTKTWWTAQAGLGGADFPKYGLVSATRKFAAYPFDAQVKIASRLDVAAQRVNAEDMRRSLDFGYFAGRNGGVEAMSLIDRNLQNASTPAEWARYLQHAFVGADLSDAGYQRFRDVMNKGKGKGYLRVPFKTYGGKSGNTARVLTYSGFLETLSGDRVIYVYMNDSSQNLITRDETPQAFMLINAALKSVMRPEDLVRPKPTKKPAPVTAATGAKKTSSPR